jgi:LysR family transcriptional activator of glutamate synthase operon
MDTRTLRWFQLVGDGVTLTEVSEIERVSQPGISRALARLEEEVGAPLLRKHGRTLRLTAAGAAFKQQVDEMLHRLDDGLAAASQAVDPETGTVRLAFQSSLATWLVPVLIRSFRAAHPLVLFSLHGVRGHEIRSSLLESGEADLVIATTRLSRERTVRLRLMDQPLSLAVGPEHPLANRTRVSLGEVSDETFLMLRPTTSMGKFTRELCDAAGFEPLVGFEGDDLPALRGFVAAGLGIAIIPSTGEGGLDGLSSPVRYIPIDGTSATQEIGMSWSSEHRLLPSAELFRRHVADLAAAGGLPSAVPAPPTPRGYE